jgi:DNA-binding NarL/FixJ family response regulator
MGSQGADESERETMTGVDKSKVSVMVVDDHPIWRDGVARDLAENGFDVRATAADGDAAVRISRAVRPDVVLMDHGAAVDEGARAVRQRRAQ